MTAAASRYEGVAIAAGAAGLRRRWSVVAGLSAAAALNWGIAILLIEELDFLRPGSFLQNSNLGVVMATVGW